MRVSDNHRIGGYYKFFGVVGLMELHASLDTVYGLEVFNSCESQLFTQESALLVFPEGVVGEGRLDGRVGNVGIHLALVFGGDARELARGKPENSKSESSIGVSNIVS